MKKETAGELARVLERTPEKPLRKSTTPPSPHSPTHSCSLTFLGIEDAGLAQLAEEGTPATGGFQVGQVEVGWVQPTGQVGEACRRKKKGCTTYASHRSFLPAFSWKQTILAISPLVQGIRGLTPASRETLVPLPATPY